MTQQETPAFTPFQVVLSTAEAATAFVQAMEPYMTYFMGQGSPAQNHAASQRRAPRAIGETEEGYTDKDLRDFARMIEKETGVPMVDEGGEGWPTKGRLPKAWKDYLTGLKRERALKDSGQATPSEEPLEVAVVDDPTAEGDKVLPTQKIPRKGLGIGGKRR